MEIDYKKSLLANLTKMGYEFADKNKLSSEDTLRLLSIVEILLATQQTEEQYKTLYKTITL